jgi:biopolymer transport protein ExbB/TolQ
MPVRRRFRFHPLASLGRCHPVSLMNVLSAALLRSPLLWGGALAFAFFALIHGGIVSDPTVVRYLAGHWVEYVEVAMFCVGLAALVLKAGDIVRQRRSLGEATLGEIPAGGQDPAEAATLLERLPAAEAARGYLPARLREALDLVVRTGSADGLEDHAKYLSDLDAARAAQGYGLVRFVIWAIPIMGFLGSVIGITVAIACLSPTQLENISGVVAGLGTAFDTTATALGLSMVLMFLQFVVDRLEQGLLNAVDRAAWEQLAGRFQSLAGSDGTVLAVAKLGESLSRGSSRLLEAQEQAWRSLERTAAAGLQQTLGNAAETLRETLAESLDASLVRWGEALSRVHDEHASRREQRWTDAAESLAGAIRGLERHQQVLDDQTKMLGEVVGATRDLAVLERSLDANLGTLASSGRFEEALATLAAAVQLLAARAGTVTDDRHVDLRSARRVGKAA